MDDRAAPLITISDPARPGVPVDLLGAGDERDPWRPSRRQWQMVLVLLLVVAVTVPIGVVVRDRRAEAAAERAAVAAIALVATIGQLDGSHETPEHAMTVGLRNDGPDAVRLLRLTIDDPLYGAVDASAQLPQYGIAELDVPLDTACPKAIPRAAPTGATARVRTARGSERDVPVALPEDIGLQLLGQLRFVCGVLLPGDAFSLQPSSTPQTRGLTTTVEVQGVVHGILPVVLTRFEAAPGFTVQVSPRLPLRVPGQSTPDEFGFGVPLTVTLTVIDCATALATGDPDFFGSPFATVTVTGPDGRDEAPVDLLLFAGTDGTSDAGYDALGGCPQRGAVSSGPIAVLQ